jgi:hypothetical protein
MVSRRWVVVLTCLALVTSVSEVVALTAESPVPVSQDEAIGVCRELTRQLSDKPTIELRDNNLIRRYRVSQNPDDSWNVDVEVLDDVRGLPVIESWQCTGLYRSLNGTWQADAIIP